jgi:hypothetical protein
MLPINEIAFREAIASQFQISASLTAGIMPIPPYQRSKCEYGAELQIT